MRWERLIVLAALVLHGSLSAQNRVPGLYRIERISEDGFLSIAHYAFVSNETVKTFPQVKFWDSLLTNQLAPREIYAQEPDWTVELLSNGLACLSHPSDEFGQYVQAQSFASNAAVGMWHRPGQLSNEIGSYNISGRPDLLYLHPPGEAKHANPAAGEANGFIRRLARHPSAKYIIPLVLGLLGLNVVDLLTAWLIFKQRRRVKLVVVGPRSSGKDSIYCRLRYKAMPLDDLHEQVKKVKHRAEASLPMFEFNGWQVETRCVRPGNNEELQIVEEIGGDSAWKCLLDLGRLSRFLFPETVIWLIVLAPTEGQAIDRINQAYLEYQKGYLCLILAILNGGKRRRRRPPVRLVLLCMNKADLFLIADPLQDTDNPTQKNLKNCFAQRFRDHLEVLDRACKKRGIAFEKTSCSATRAWGFDYIRARIEDALLDRPSSHGQAIATDPVAGVQQTR